MVGGSSERVELWWLENTGDGLGAIYLPVKENVTILSTITAGAEYQPCTVL